MRKRENRISAAFMIITMIISASPLISRYCINGHDLGYHLLRIESLKEGILIGRPFMKVNTLFFGGAGYAATLFDTDILLHIPALLRVLHVSIGKSYHIYAALIFILCYLSTFYSVWKMSLSKFAGTAAAIILTLCHYHMDDMLVRADVGENTAFIFMPLAVYGIFNVIYEDMDKPAVFGMGFAGLILTHSPSCILMACFAALAFLLNIKRFIAAPRVFVRMCIVSCLACLVTAYQWVPMLEQFASGSFYAAENWKDIIGSSVSFSQMLSSSFPCIGLLLFILAIPRVFLSRRDYPILAFIDLLLVMAVIFAVGATDIMPWNLAARYFGLLRYPWRLFAASSVFLAMADAAVLTLFLDRTAGPGRETAAEAALILVFAVCAWSALSHQNGENGYYDYSDDYYSYKPFTADVGAGEWLPEGVYDREMLTGQSGRLVFSDGSTGAIERKRARITTKVSGSFEYADVPFVYYKGYRAVLTDNAGNRTKLEITGEGENGLCRVYLDGRTGDLDVVYRGTLLQYISLVISHLFLLLIFDLWYLKNKYKKKLKERAALAGANLGKIAGFVLIAAASSCMLTACSVSGASAESVYVDPNEVIDYLNNMNGTGGEEEEPIPEEDLVRANYSLRGYDEEGQKYAVMIDESTGEQVISVVTPEEAAERTGKEPETVHGLYESLIKEEAGNIQKEYRTKSLKQRIMHETDALLCLEVFPEKAGRYGIDKLASELGHDILSIPETKIEDATDKYDCAAVLAKAAYVMADDELAEPAKERAERLFADAEDMDVSESEPAAARLWAAAELYRLTGRRTYRSVVDAIAMDVVPEGATYEDPGYYGLFAYLMAPYPTNYNVCTSMMNVVFDEANRLIKIPMEDEFLDTRVDDMTQKNDEKVATRMLEEAFLVTMTEYVSMSIEYTDFVQNRMNYICGANLSGTDFTAEDGALYDSPKLFVLTGLCR
ncbi:MAG: glycoside hydrolase family 9 protein [Lachnospiraceae bacterium]|nr:glycoside hydrolase family 9 protein [Lachnospiraceae bacterium]